MLFRRPEVCVAILCCIATSAAADSHLKSDPKLENAEAVKRECIELGRRYATLIDSDQRDPARIAELFDPHGTFEGVTAKYVGRDNIKLAFESRPDNRKTFHLVSNEIAEVYSRNMVVVESYYVYYRYDGETEGPYAPVGEPYSMGTYYDECVRTEDGRWLWQLRKTERKFMREGG